MSRWEVIAIVGTAVVLFATGAVAGFFLVRSFR